jgi:hypothetical protein
MKNRITVFLKNGRTQISFDTKTTALGIREACTGHNFIAATDGTLYNFNDQEKPMIVCTDYNSDVFGSPYAEESCNMVCRLF